MFVDSEELLRCELVWKNYIWV